jgi:hypothetical protein
VVGDSLVVFMVKRMLLLVVVGTPDRLLKVVIDRWQ